jgi:hypothetical protein
MRGARLVLACVAALGTVGRCASEGVFEEPGAFQLVPVPGVEGLFRAEAGSGEAAEEAMADGDAGVLKEEGGAGALRGLAARKAKAPRGPLKKFLFVGNSFTFVNKLPATFAGMAKASRRKVAAYFFGIGGASFQSHWNNPNLPRIVNWTKWEAITMQEQSMFLSQLRQTYSASSVQYAEKLYNYTFRQNANTVALFLTWGYENGNPSFMTGLDDNYSKMQTRLSSGYNYTLAALEKIRDNTRGDASIIISPVGNAWAIAQAQERFRGKLWQLDGMHPLPCGTYLAASVFYAKLFGESPVGNRFRIKGVSGADGNILQQIAADVVLGNK